MLYEAGNGVQGLGKNIDAGRRDEPVATCHQCTPLRYRGESSFLRNLDNVLVVITLPAAP